MEISFLGGTGTVTGSKYLFDDGDAATLIDCGLFQGFKQLRLRNWQPLPIDPRRISSVVLTHAHIDHSGYLPLLVRNGFSGRVYCSKATRELCQILLPDSAHLQEEEARYANKRGFSKHKPALPLYTVEDANRALEHLHAIDFDEPIRLSSASSARLLPAGHILGAAMIMIESRGKRILFSGDLGRPNDPIMRPPTKVESCRCARARVRLTETEGTALPIPSSSLRLTWTAHFRAVVSSSSRLSPWDACRRFCTWSRASRGAA